MLRNVQPRLPHALGPPEAAGGTSQRLEVHLLLCGGHHGGEEGWEGTAQSSAFVQGDGADEKGYKGEGLKEGGGGNN